MRKSFKYLMSSLIAITLVIIPHKSSDGQITDLIHLAEQFITNVTTIHNTVQTAQEVEGILEQLACAKYKYDKYRAQVEVNSCLAKTQFKVLDVELSSVYNDIANTAVYLINNSGDQSGQSKFSDILKKLREICERMKIFNDQVEAHIVITQQQISQRKFAASSLSHSF